MRVAAGMVRLEADQVHHLADLLAPFRTIPDVVDPQALADAVGDRRPRIEAGVRVLEDDLHPPAERLEVLAAERRQILPVEPDRARGRFDEAQDKTSDRRLAAARFADEAEGLAAAHVERDAIDGLDAGDLALQDPAVDRKVLHEVADLEQRVSLDLAHAGAVSGRGSALPASS